MREKGEREAAEAIEGSGPAPVHPINRTTISRETTDEVNIPIGLERRKKGICPRPDDLSLVLMLNVIF